MKNGKEIPPIVERKPDTDTNGNKVTQSVLAQKQREKQLYPLRIDTRTVIYVRKEKCTSQYAEQYRKRTQYKPDLKGTAVQSHNNENQEYA